MAHISEMQAAENARHRRVAEDAVQAAWRAYGLAGDVAASSGYRTDATHVDVLTPEQEELDRLAGEAVDACQAAYDAAKAYLDALRRTGR